MIKLSVLKKREEKITIREKIMHLKTKTAILKAKRRTIKTQNLDRQDLDSKKTMKY